MGVIKRKSLMIIEFYDHMFFFFHLVQIYFGPLNCHYYVNTLIQCAMNVYFSHVNSKKKSPCSRIRISFHILVADGRCAKLSTAGVHCQLCSSLSKSEFFGLISSDQS